MGEGLVPGVPTGDMRSQEKAGGYLDEGQIAREELET